MSTNQPAAASADTTTFVKPDLVWLTNPLVPQEIEWKIQTAKNNKTLVVPYIDNRAVMDRLNQAVGWDKWETKFLPFNDGFLCTIKMTLPDGRQIEKTDGAGRSQIEPVKGGISDAMKRCAVQFGLGRSLYDYPKIYLEGEHRYIPDWGITLLDRIVKAFNGGRLEKPMYFLKEADAQRPSQQ